MSLTPTVYPFKARLINGSDKNLADYQGKVLLIVNTASGCGFTPQLKDLQEIRNEYASQGFEVLGFPSNDFGKQEPLDGSEINNFCEVNYGVEFPIFDKYLINRKGEVVEYFYPFTKPTSSKMKKKIQRLLHEKQ